MKCNEDGKTLIKNFEGLKLHAYICPAGVRTIGYGHTSTDFDDDITLSEAYTLFGNDLRRVESQLNHVCEIDKITLNENQFSALCSFVFNLGIGNFQCSTLHHCLINGDYETAANEFLKWCKANNQVSNGLLTRREAERALFLKA